MTLISTPKREIDRLSEILRSEGDVVLERLDHWASRTPDKVFFHYGEDGVSLTYAEFSRLTDQIAGNLAASGVAPGERVAVFTTNSMLAAQIMFGAWKAGAIYAPVNFSFKGSLLTYQIDDTRPSVLVTDPGLLPEVNAVVGDLEHVPSVVLYTPPVGTHDHRPDPGSVALGYPRIAWEALTAPAVRPDVTVSFDDPANIFYTSGTTGPPKGVVQPHRWMAGYTYNLRRSMTTEDVVYNDLPLYHVGGAIVNVARAVWVGCEVAVWDKFSARSFWSRIKSRGATTAVLLDVMIPWLIKVPETSQDRENTLNKVHMQPLPRHHHEVASRFGIDIVTAGFGQTESGAPLGVYIEEVPEGEGTPAHLYRGLTREEIRDRVVASGARMVKAQDVMRKGVMGTPSPFVDVIVLDERDQPCGVREPGQLAVRSKVSSILLMEYFAKPEATVKAMSNQWFHTGDAAVLQPDGMFDFVDRLGDRIRVRGENVSSFQVEDLLLQHESVQMVAVFSIASEEGDEDDIVAFVVPVESVSITAEDIGAYAESVMPKYMRPRHIRVVEELPRTPTNKIEKYKLRAQITDELLAYHDA